MGFGVSSPSWQQLTKETMVSWLIMLFLSQAFGNEIIAPQQPVHHGFDTAGSRILVSGHTGPLTIYPIAAGASYQHHTPYLHVAPAPGVSAPVYHVEEPVHHVEPAHVVPPLYHVEEPVHHVAPAHGVPTPVYHVEEPVHHAAPAPVYHVEGAPVIVAPLYDQHQEVPNVHPDDVTEHVEVEDADAENYQDKREGSSSGFIPLVNSDRYEDPVNLHGYSEFVEQVMDYVD